MSASKALWTCGRFITIDESMIAYKGVAIHWTVYNPNKPIKHGALMSTHACSHRA